MTARCDREPGSPNKKTLADDCQPGFSTFGGSRLGRQSGPSGDRPEGVTRWWILLWACRDPPGDGI